MSRELVRCPRNSLTNSQLPATRYQIRPLTPKAPAVDGLQSLEAGRGNRVAHWNLAAQLRASSPPVRQRPERIHGMCHMQWTSGTVHCGHAP